MNSQDCLTYLFDAIALTFAALMLIDLATGLPLQSATAIAVPNPLDMSAVFDAVDSVEEIWKPMVTKIETVVVEDIPTLPEAPICQPMVAKTVIAVAPKPDTDFTTMSREEITAIAKEHGIGGYRPGVNRRRSKAELLAELGKLQLV